MSIINSFVVAVKSVSRYKPEISTRFDLASTLSKLSNRPRSSYWFRGILKLGMYCLYCWWAIPVLKLTYNKSSSMSRIRSAANLSIRFFLLAMKEVRNRLIKPAEVMSLCSFLARLLSCLLSLISFPLLIAIWHFPAITQITAHCWFYMTFSFVRNVCMTTVWWYSSIDRNFALFHRI